MSIKQVIRFGFVGLVSNAFIFIIYLVITDIGVEPKKAMTLTYIIGVIIGFFGNRKWTFDHGGKFSIAALRYVVVYFFGYLLNFMLLFVFVDYLGYFHQWVQFVSILVVAVFLFLSSKYFVFSKKCKLE